jgi:cytochrome b561
VLIFVEHGPPGRRLPARLFCFEFHWFCLGRRGVRWSAGLDGDDAMADEALQYDRLTVWLHWVTAIVVVEQWVGAQVIDFFPKGAPRIDARSVHIALGVVLACVLVARIVWRLTAGRRLPPADRGPLQLVARAVQIGLYVLLATMVILGGALVWVRGDQIFNLFSVPAYDPGNRGLVERVEDLHGLVGYLILAVAGLHATAALAHRYLWHDGVLARMWR